MIEAQESGTPLLVLTADRPPELRDCASGQAIDQLKLYGGHVNLFHELAVPEPRLELLRYLRQTVAHAWQCARIPEPGPVHLNCPFRDPLPPVRDASATGLSRDLDEAFFGHLSGEAPAAGRITARQRLSAPRGIIVAGPCAVTASGVYAAVLQRLASSLHWPVLADALSPARHHDLSGTVVVTAYDALLRNARVGRALLPRQVLCLGGWPTSKVLRGWLAQSGAEVLLVAPTARNRDALHGRTRTLQLPLENFDADRPAQVDTTYVTAWRQAEEAARTVLDDKLAATRNLFEGKAAWLLSESLPEATPVFVASSMPVRDAEYFWRPGGRRTQFYFNRGANGIDGTLSTALGMAHGGKPSVLLTGDLALLHDANGFLIRPKFSGSLTIVLINNRGGGIFEHLPVARFDPPFEDYFATPQEVDFARLCAAYGLKHTLVRDWAQFTGLVSRLPVHGIRVLEVRTDRKRDAAFRKKLFADAARAAGRAL
ncbi:MAG: 2-succinyl-5-enolpyruvyl-6-hydroxy-3-cyclohexene-1-carboxylic-acid synthase [Verrucomicrobia bacterium RIFCSPLOWO2_12_FULL_64_8]|nr:MAG: 2-succinyl-5-enolpyruvyl-6-hydroxy-3-cyclohexene-1-carboxylic-acid synthase [Verrucomicrobia bacterium RIFCSPLOWO2_12_FULL_64_8]